MSVKMIDDRTQVLGTAFQFDPKAFKIMADLVDLPVGAKVEIHLVDHDPQVKGIGTLVLDEEGVHHVLVEVSDRPEFTHTAVRRINRNLGHELRHVAHHMCLNQLFGEFAGPIVGNPASAQGLCAEAYKRGEHPVRDHPESWCLLPLLDVPETIAEEGK